MEQSFNQHFYFSSLYKLSAKDPFEFYRISTIMFVLPITDLSAFSSLLIWTLFPTSCYRSDHFQQYPSNMGADITSWHIQIASEAQEKSKI